MAPLGTPYFTGCGLSGGGRIDNYITVDASPALWNSNGYPDFLTFTTVQTTVQLWLSGVRGSGSAISNRIAGPTYYRWDGTNSTDLITWVLGSTGYPDRLVLWPPPRETAGMLPVSVAAPTSCTYSVWGTPATEGSIGAGTLLVSPFSISFVQSNLLRGDVGMLYGDTAGFYGFGQYLTAIGYAGAAVTAFSASGLPPGLTMLPQGVIQGTPTTNGTYPVLIRATDSAGYYHEQLFGIRIGPLIDVDITVPITIPPGGADLVAAGPGMAVALAAESFSEGRGIPITVPDQSTSGNWGFDRIDLKVRQEEHG
jgi:Putative Ig domain